MFNFEVEETDGGARACRIETARGVVVETPVFMPVATQATVKALTPSQLRDAGVGMVVSNAFHLSIRPGFDIIEGLGGIHRFMGWDGAVLTDSGGYQIFSLGERVKVTDSGASFQSPVDGSPVEMDAESSLRVQNALGSDVAMAFDECVPYPCDRARAEIAVGRTLNWADRCLKAHNNQDQALFGIVQGSTYEDLRRRCARELVGMDFDGYAVGGLSVGEGGPLMREVLDYTITELPESKVRYLMGVGTPDDIVDAIGMGVDMFDCVIPTRNGRNGWAYTGEGHVKVRNAAYTRDDGALDSRCSCYTCASFSRAFLRHLFNVDEILALTLVSFHNISFFENIVREARRAILGGNFENWRHLPLSQKLYGTIGG